jgi:hypothetical protein
LGPLECELATKFMRQNVCKRVLGDTQTDRATAIMTQTDTDNATKVKLADALLYGGQGKTNISVTPDCTNDPSMSTDVNASSIGGWAGLQLPWLEETGGAVSGDDKTQMRKENKCRRRRHKLDQAEKPHWTVHQGSTSLAPIPTQELSTYCNSMCPRGRAVAHPATVLPTEWATLGCPTNTGQPWTKEEMWAAVARGPHRSALSPEAMAHFAAEATKKVRTKQAQIVAWDDIKDNPPCQLKISPIAAIPHKSKAYRSILDLSFRLCLANGGVRASVNNTTKKTAPAGVIDQIGECLARIVHAFAEADPEAKVFMAKWDIKDGFWCMDCANGEEWNFAFDLPQEEGKPVRLVVPTSLQMGWVESPPYFIAPRQKQPEMSPRSTRSIQWECCRDTSLKSIPQAMQTTWHCQNMTRQTSALHTW